MIFHTKYPKNFAPPSALCNFFKCAPLTWNPGSAPVCDHSGAYTWITIVFTAIVIYKWNGISRIMQEKVAKYIYIFFKLNISSYTCFFLIISHQVQCIIQNTHWLSGFDSKYYKFRNVILRLFLGLHFSFNQIPDNQNSCPVIWSQRTFFILTFLLEYYIFFELF